MHNVIRLGCYVVLSVLSTVAAGATIAPLQPTDAERSDLEARACRGPHAVALERIDGRVYGKRTTSPADAEVHCASHAVYQGTPMHYVVRCARTGGRWSCDSEWNEMRVISGDERIAVRVEGDIPIGIAHQTILKVANGGTFQGYPLRKALAPPCYLHKRESKEFMDLKCDGWHIVVSMWCPQANCPRVFSMTRLGS